jgi:hypothetical protein
MTVIIIAYPPSGGGNHLKNILCLDKSFANSSDLNLENYNNGKREVHSTTGRNINESRIQAAANTDQDYILHGHFGELAPWRNQLNAIANKKWLVLSFDTKRDRYLLNERQHRLGQFGHEYYLNEEQPFLYQQEFYQSYFTGTPENIYTLSIDNFWNPNITKTVDTLNCFLNKSINAEQAQVLHRQWHINNDINYY